MDDPSDSDERPSGGTRSRVGEFPVLRAGLVLVVFVVATIVVLANLHSSKPAVASTATSTTAPTGTTATTRPSRGHGATTTTTPAAPPADVPVLVANGSGVTGAAAAFTARLHTAGWSTLTPTNATTTVTTSHVYYVAGQQTSAAEVAADLMLPVSAVAPYTTAAPISSIGTADVVVIIGPDVATPASVATAPTTTTTTTAPGSTTG